MQRRRSPSIASSRGCSSTPGWTRKLRQKRRAAWSTASQGTPSAAWRIASGAGGTEAETNERRGALRPEQVSRPNATAHDDLRARGMRVREPMPFGKTASSSGDGSEPRAIAADPRDTEMWRLPLRKERAHGRRARKGPVRQGSRANPGRVLGGWDGDTPAREQERGPQWSLLEKDPLLPGRMTGRKRGASRSGTSFSSGASGTRLEPRCRSDGLGGGGSSFRRSGASALF